MNHEQQSIDRLVAEKVMGWTQAWSGSTFIGYDAPDGKKWAVAREGEAPINRPLGWSPSTDIAQAFEVVEVMRARGWWWHIDAEPPMYDGADIPSVTVSLYSDPAGSDSVDGYAPTVAQAICEAAISAMEGA